jgi:hypothetical protein
MNNVFVFVLSIIGIVMTAGVAQTYIKQGRKRSESSDDTVEMLATIDRLEERIQVLERIVTEKHVDLKTEIDRL